MSFAFEFTDEDVAIVLRAMGLPDDGADIFRQSIDAAAVEAAALHGDDLGQQTSYAHEEIRRQLEELGVGPRVPSR